MFGLIRRIRERIVEVAPGMGPAPVARDPRPTVKPVVDCIAVTLQGSLVAAQERLWSRLPPAVLILHHYDARHRRSRPRRLL